MNKNIIALSVVLASLVSSQAFASGFFRLSGMYQTEETGYEGSTSDSSVTRLDLGAGLITQGGWLLGALYGTDKYKAGGGTLDRTGIGPSVGWVGRGQSGFYVVGTYFLSLERSDDLEGKGYQIDLGYRFSLGKVSIAPQMSYKDFAYDKSNGQSLSPNYIEKRIDPYIALWIEI